MTVSIVLGLVLILASAGTAVFLLSNGDDQPASEVATSPSTTPAETDTSTVEDTSGDEAPSAAVDGPDTDPDVMAGEITTLITDHHQAIVDADYSAAWDLLTSRKQNKYENEPGGYDAWVSNQRTLGRYLTASGAEVEVRDYNAVTQVAEIYVSGMAWSSPDSSCSEWSGVTWVRWEDGAWKYDPGYSTTPQRTREWKPRYDQLLGGRC